MSVVNVEAHTGPEYQEKTKALLKLVKNTKGLVYVQGDFANAATYRLFKARGYDAAKSLEEADIVVWTGGEDINPAIYGEKPNGANWWSDTRDREDLKAIQIAVEGKKFLVGVCRGAQLLNCVPNGGRLWQDCNHHGSSKHLVTDRITGGIYMINSIHHQQMRVTDRAEIVASTNLSTYKKSENDYWLQAVGTEDLDVEVAFYPDTKSLCFQAHPEFDVGGPTERYFFNLIERYFENG